MSVVLIVAIGALVAASLALGWFAAREVRATKELETMRRQLEDVARQLEIERDSAGAADRSRTQFLAHMSHELRTPLTGVIGLSTLLSTEAYGPLNERQHEHIQQIAQCGADLLALINDLTDLSKVEVGRTMIELETVNTAVLVRDALRIVRKLAMARNVMVSESVVDPAPSVLADRRRLKQVLVNLLTNAVEVSAPGGVIGVTVATADGEVKLSVWDEGPGLADQDIGKIFEPFRLSEHDDGRTDTTGLGLAIGHELVELHGGALEVSSEEGTGTRFVVTLPEATGFGVVDLEGPFENAVPLTAALVLVAEDDPVAQTVLRDTLEAADLSVEIVADGQDALQTAHSLQPDVVLLDVRLPGEIDGFEVVRRLKSDEATAAIPVIAVTAQAMRDDAERCRQAGCDGYVPKPIDAYVLLTAISDVLRDVAETSSG